MNQAQILGNMNAVRGDGNERQRLSMVEGIAYEDYTHASLQPDTARTNRRRASMAHQEIFETSCRYTDRSFSKIDKVAEGPQPVQISSDSVGATVP